MHSAGDSGGSCGRRQTDTCSASARSGSCGILGSVSSADAVGAAPSGVGRYNRETRSSLNPGALWASHLSLWDLRGLAEAPSHPLGCSVWCRGCGSPFLLPPRPGHPGEHAEESWGADSLVCPMRPARAALTGPAGTKEPRLTSSVIWPPKVTHVPGRRHTGPSQSTCTGSWPLPSPCGAQGTAAGRHSALLYGEHVSGVCRSLAFTSPCLGATKQRGQ